jgi:hypothetical protein
MKSRPILFSAPMVRALLAGTKTQTRRPLREGTWLDPKEGVIRMCSVGNGVTGFQSVACPYGQPGDQLWVRETWAHHVQAQSAERDEDGPFVYAADGPQALQARLASKWTPGIHMFRWASRITLEITAVCVERLQDISEADAQAEGVEYSERFGGYCIGEAQHFNSHDPRESYWSLWEAINGPGSVEANPWAWCLSFKRV